MANLLEQSSNAVALDNNKQWRVHRYVDGQAKFWAPNLKLSNLRENTVDQLNSEQLQIAHSKDQFLVITSHDMFFKKTFVNDPLPDSQHFKILLKSQDSRETQINFYRKNLVEFQEKNIVAQNINEALMPGYDVVLPSLPREWPDVQHLACRIGLDLQEQDFVHYKKILSGELKYTTPGIEYYESYNDHDGTVKYLKIN